MAADRRRAVADLLANSRFEVLPVGAAAVSELPVGTTVTVTSSPNKGLEATIDRTEELAKAGLRVVPHLSAKQMPTERLPEFVERLAAAGVEDVFVVGGDAPEPAGDFTSGLELLEALAKLEHPFVHVGVPAYPEGHPSIDDATLTEALLAKQAHATYLVTQLCFDADAITTWLEQARQAGVSLPAYAGIAGAVDVRKLVNVSMRIGIGDSLRFVKGNRAVAWRLARGGYKPDGLVKRLGAHVQEGRADLEGFHIYTFNQINDSYQWAEEAQRKAQSSGRGPGLRGPTGRRSRS